MVPRPSATVRVENPNSDVVVMSLSRIPSDLTTRFTEPGEKRAHPSPSPTFGDSNRRTHTLNSIRLPSAVFMACKERN